jgi:hypothetical protein
LGSRNNAGLDGADRRGRDVLWVGKPSRFSGLDRTPDFSTPLTRFSVLYDLARGRLFLSLSTSCNSNRTYAILQKEELSRHISCSYLVPLKARIKKRTIPRDVNLKRDQLAGPWARSHPIFAQGAYTATASAAVAVSPFNLRQHTNRAPGERLGRQRGQFG